MLPEFLFTVGSSMQDMVRDDFALLNGTSTNGCEKDIDPSPSPPPSALPLAPSLSKQTSTDIVTQYETSLSLNGIKLEDSSSPLDLFPTHATTWQQHPMNSHENAHHRLQQHHHQHQHPVPHHHHHHHHHLHHHHRLDVGTTSKLLLQSSDDPLICRGANDDEHAPEFKTLIAAVANDNNNKPQPLLQPQLQPQLQPISQPISQPMKLASPRPPAQQSVATMLLTPQRRPQDGCSSLTKQQLKAKASLMSVQQSNQQQQQQSAALPAPAAVKSQRSAKPAKRKSAVKLRFHHQALPPEYLSHYEATQGQHVAGRAAAAPPVQREARARDREPAAGSVKLTQAAKLPPPKSAHENVRSWLQKIAEIQRSAQQQQQQHQNQQQMQLQQPQQLLQHDANNNHQASRHHDTHSPAAYPPLNASASEHTCQALAPPLLEDNSAPPLPQTLDATLGSVQPQPQPQMPTQAQPISVQRVERPSLVVGVAAAKRVINYADLPYMGEITLDNSKPRRGRKPKKTDICHLIYKNYGTIFPGTPKNVFAGKVAVITSAATTNTTASANSAPTVITKLKPEVLDNEQPDGIGDGVEEAEGEGEGEGEEPLNLCLRDQSAAVDFYSVSSGDDDEAPPSEAERISISPATCKSPRPVAVATIDANPSASLLLHPVSVYYQKLLESGTLIQKHGQAFGLPAETIQKDNQLALKIPIPSGLFITPKLEKTSPTPNALGGSANSTSSHNNLEYPEPLSTPSSIKSENSVATTATTTSSTANNGQHVVQPPLTPQKRKRSAIFIPPMPAENATNPATEVSICKFKFTGGAKPTLQEKKMLSVDSDGNYRYYSGTGDKSMRGYEFFPRESLQQSGLLPGVNCAGAFLNATGEKISIDIPPPSAGLSNELLQIPPDSPYSISPQQQLPASQPQPAIICQPRDALGKATAAATALHVGTLPTSIDDYLVTPTPMTTPSSPMPMNVALTQRRGAGGGDRRKKSSRRSAQREKLEKTFKEKGFLIQTQQLESAEGATYCKFRQLKKFTRYLFRNWKDYLPDELHQANAAAAAAAVAHLGATTLTADDDDLSAEADPMVAAGQQAAIESLLASHGISHCDHGGQRLLRESDVSSAGGAPGLVPPALYSIRGAARIGSSDVRAERRFEADQC